VVGLLLFLQLVSGYHRLGGWKNFIFFSLRGLLQALSVMNPSTIA